MKARGSRAEVMHGKAKRTSGGLMKKDLKYNKRRRIVSRKMSLRAKKEKRLEKAGYKTKKGTFNLFKKSKRSSGRRSRHRSRRRKSRRRQQGVNHKKYKMHGGADMMDTEGGSGSYYDDGSESYYDDRIGSYYDDGSRSLDPVEHDMLAWLADGARDDSGGGVADRVEEELRWAATYDDGDVIGIFVNEFDFIQRLLVNVTNTSITGMEWTRGEEEDIPVLISQRIPERLALDGGGQDNPVRAVDHRHDAPDAWVSLLRFLYNELWSKKWTHGDLSDNNIYFESPDFLVIDWESIMYWGDEARDWYTHNGGDWESGTRVTIDGVLLSVDNVYNILIDINNIFSTIKGWARDTWSAFHYSSEWDDVEELMDMRIDTLVRAGEDERYATDTNLSNLIEWYKTFVSML